MTRFETQKQCVVNIIGQGTLDGILAGRVRPESVLTPEQMRQVGEQYFGGAPPGVPPGGPPGGGPPPEILTCVERILGKERTAALLRGSQATPEEFEKAKSCFPQTPEPGPGAGGPPPEQVACAEKVLGKERVAALVGGAQGTPEEFQRVQHCLGAPPPSGSPPPQPTGPPGSPEQCVESCLTYTRPDGSRFTREECSQMCAGGGPQPSPPPTGTPGPVPTPPTGEQCVQQCVGYGYPEDYCQRACAGEQVTPPTATPPPGPEPPPPPPPPDTSQCVASCVGYPKADGTTYTESECQALCGGSVGGAATARSPLDWLVRSLLDALGI